MVPFISKKDKTRAFIKKPEMPMTTAHTAERDALLCCPFCGGRNLKVNTGDRYDGGKASIYCLQCTLEADFDCRGLDYEELTEYATERWNTRATHKEPEDMREAERARLSAETLKEFGADPKVRDAIRNPASPFSRAWHKREDEHRAQIAALQSQPSEPLQDTYKTPTALNISSEDREALCAAFEKQLIDEGRASRLHEHTLHSGIYADNETTRRFNSFKAGVAYQAALQSLPRQLDVYKKDEKSNMSSERVQNIDTLPSKRSGKVELPQVRLNTYAPRLPDETEADIFVDEARIKRMRPINGGFMIPIIILNQRAATAPSRVQLGDQNDK